MNVLKSSVKCAKFDEFVSWIIKNKREYADKKGVSTCFEVEVNIL